MDISSSEVKANRLKVIEALESGKYKQTVRVFYSDATGCYCSWGVMLDVFGQLSCTKDVCDITAVNNVFDKVGMDRSIQDHYFQLYGRVTRMNDCGATFEQIAQYLRQLWDLPREEKREPLDMDTLGKIMKGEEA